MPRVLRLGAVILAMSAASAVAGPPTVASMQWQRRVLLVSSPDRADPRLEAQRRALNGWTDDARDRDVTVVRIVGDGVEGAADAAADLRRRYGLPGDRFAVVLIGKDGEVAVRSDRPVPSASLARTIDAMPMRRAGQR